MSQHNQHRPRSAWNAQQKSDSSARNSTGPAQVDLAHVLVEIPLSTYRSPCNWTTTHSFQRHFIIRILCKLHGFHWTRGAPKRGKKVASSVSSGGIADTGESQCRRQKPQGEQVVAYWVDANWNFCPWFWWRTRDITTQLPQLSWTRNDSFAWLRLPCSHTTLMPLCGVQGGAANFFFQRPNPGPSQCWGGGGLDRLRTQFGM